MADTPNPKCSKCKCYWIPDETDIKSSGLYCKTCKNVEIVIKNGTKKTLIKLKNNVKHIKKKMLTKLKNIKKHTEKKIT